MKKSALIPKNIGCGWLCFYIHFITEVICFYVITNITGESIYSWIIPLVYDTLAFVPQSLIGRLSDKFKKIPIGIIGILMLSASSALFAFELPNVKYPALIIMCLGNACTHVSSAEITLRASCGKLSHSALFVAGGSFGVITGKLLAKALFPEWILSIAMLTAIPFAILAEDYRKEADKSDNPCEKFNYTNEKMPAAAIIVIAVLVVAVRGYMGYGIPTSWNKTTLQTVALFCIMGIGKALGGVVADAFGVRKTAIFTTLAALPFLLFGDKHMFVSLIGVMFFSMTMSITLAMLTSVLQKTPGLAFGLTTIGLYIGSVPIFFFKLTTVGANCIMITVLTLLCTLALSVSIRKDVKNGE